jgi:carboxypeptidase family protein/TonB-dependent receptor-like protein
MSTRVGRLLRFVLCVGFSICVSLTLAFPQSDLGRISGFVKDPSGAIVPNAKISVQNKSGLQRSTVTNESGLYTITNVPPGLYTVIAEAPGFQRYQSADNKLDPSSNLVVDATLTVGATTQTVEVSASAVQLQTESATVQKLVNREQIDALELNGRNPIFMANLVPGVRGTNLNGLSIGVNGLSTNINGARTPESLVTYDGAPAMRTRSNGAILGNPDVDSVQEIQVLTADYGAEYGRSSGGQIRIVSKSGTQTFHGSAFEYVRNTIFNANTWARNQNPLTQFTAPDHYNQFGYNIGGPVYIPNHFNSNKDKLFFYWGQEWVKRVFTDTSSQTVPTLGMRQGDFRDLLTNPIFGYTATTGIVKDPTTGTQFVASSNPADPNFNAACTGAATCANVIPSARLSKNGLGILNAWPVPDLTVPIGNNNWTFFAKHPQNQRKDTLSLDWNATDNQHLSFHRFNYKWFEYQPLDGGTNETPKFFDRPNYTYTLNHTWTISPTKVNEVLLSYSQDVVHIPIDAANYLDRTKGAAQGPGFFGTNYSYIFNDSKLLATRIPSVNMSKFSTLNGGPYPSHSAGPVGDLSDSFTWVKGNHTWKFGGLYEYSGENDNDEINVSACSTCTNNQNGQFQFVDNRAGGTGVAAANAALGLFDRYSEIGHRAYTVFRGSMWEAFAQDTWKVSQNLTLTPGLRYSVIVPYHTYWGNQAVFDPQFYDPSLAVTVNPITGLIVGTPTLQQLYNGMVIPGSGFPSDAKNHVPEANTSQWNFLFRGLPDHYSDIQWNDIQPRLGAAYQLNNKTVVRAGAGRFYTRLGVSDSIFLGGNPPFQPMASLTNGSVDALGPSSAAAIPLVVTTQSKDFRNPEAWNWNASVQRELPWNLIANVGYVGRRGLHLQREANINQPTTATVAANPTVKNIDALRPYKGFGSIRETDNVASSKYNSLQTSLSRRFVNGLMFGVSYTLSKSMDDGSNQRDVVPDTYNTSMLWGPSEFDTRHILTINYLYELPFFRNQSNLVGKVLGGWQLSGITQFQSGVPCSAAQNKDFTGVGVDSNFGCGVNGQYFAWDGKLSYPHTFGANGQWVCCASDFTAPPAGTFVTQQVRDIIYQPGFQNWNMGLFKKIPVNERVNFQFRAEAFNVWNHPNWCGSSGCNGTTNINLDPSSTANFGKVLTKGSERNLQLSLRAEF